MPTVQVTVPQDDLDQDQRQRLVGQLTETVGQFFQQEKQEDVRDFVVVHIRETAPGGYALGGEIIG